MMDKVQVIQSQIDQLVQQVEQMIDESDEKLCESEISLLSDLSDQLVVVDRMCDGILKQV